MAAGRKLLQGGAAIAGAAAGAGALASAAGTIGAASYLARRLLTPERERLDNCVILAVDPDAGTITLDVTEETILSGRYGIWTDNGRGHLRVGGIVRIDLPERRVTRRLESVDVGAARPGPARWNGFYYGQRPDLSLGLPTTDVLVTTDIGVLPAWLVPAEAGADGGHEDDRSRWAICLHGRGGTREECLRAVPVLHRLGITTLIPCYRNDAGAPPSPDGRYNLGLSEWRDADAAVRFALAHGASDVILVGWSMGAAISLQMLDRSPMANHVSALVFDGPVIDWGDVIAHHARLARVPRPLTDLTRALLGARWARRLVGVHEPLDVADTNWQHRSGELRHRMLIIHSLEDDFVPVGPATALAAARPDIVRFEAWPASAHTKEWNTDPDRWQAVVADFLQTSSQRPMSEPSSSSSATGRN